MDAQKTYVLWLNRNTEEEAFSGQGPCARQIAAHLSAEVRAVPGKHRSAAPGGAKLVHA